MPFIDSKITVSLTPEKEESIKAKLGEAIQILNKSETYLMVGFEDNYDLYMGGSKLDKGAYVSVSLFGQASPSAYSEMTKVICDILSEELSIPGNQVYVTYHGVNYWGWNGAIFKCNTKGKSGEFHFVNSLLFSFNRICWQVI